MLKEINVHAGAVDVGSEYLHAAVYNGPIKVFKTFTSDLYEMVSFFKEREVSTVAMEATGVYWLVPFAVLEEAGLQPCVVNGAHVKNLPGRKSDMSDPQWLAELHAHGLLQPGFVPTEAVRRLRDYQRLRQDHVEMGSAHVLHMQKALDRMNIKIPQRPGNAASSKQPVRPKRLHHNGPIIPKLHEVLLRLCGGQDATAVPTLTDYTVLQIIAEVGLDMSRWPTAKQFVAWLGLAPASRQSGKRRKPEKRFRGRAGQLFCVAARSLARSRYLALGGFYRRVRATRGGQVANIAAARKVALLFYWTLKHGLDYVEHGLADYEAKYRAQSIKRLQAVARRFGLTVLSPSAIITA